jgi:hypothetical protein
VLENRETDDKNLEPENNRGESKQGEIIVRPLLVTGRDALGPPRKTRIPARKSKNSEPEPILTRIIETLAQKPF